MHQDDCCTYEDLTLSTKLNVQAGKIATHNARKLINTHLIISSFVIYIANKYTPYNIDRKMCYTSHSHQAKKLLATKYHWSMQIIVHIN